MNLLREMIGFDPFAEHFRMLENAAKAVYPKYNLVKHKDGSFSLEIAVAGFRKEDLSVKQSDKSLLIEGKPLNDVREYLHKGISTKAFKLMFPISFNCELKQVTLFDGILSVTLVNKEKEAVEKQIEIHTTPEPAKLTQE